jgi:uncharacterized membrane protein
VDLDAVFQYRVAYWHPLVVHLPLVLLPLAALAATAWAIRAAAVWRHVALASLALGAATAWWAVETGETLYAAVEGEPLVEALIAAHHAAAEWTVWASVLAAVAFVGLAVWRRRPSAAREPLALRLALLTLAWTPAVLVVYAGHVGGLMVWGVPA